MTTHRAFDRTRGWKAFSRFFDDFFKYTAADWTLTTVEAGGGNAAEAITPGSHGLLLITNDAADNDYDAFQTAEVFKFVAGKKFQFVSRFKVSDATQTDVMIGLHITDTNPFSTEPSDGVYLRKDDGDTLIDFVVKKDGTASTLTPGLGVAVLADDTFVEVEFYYDGGDNIDFFLDGVRVGSLPLTNVPDDEELAVSFCIQNGEAAIKTMTMDYIGVTAER